MVIVTNGKNVTKPTLQKVVDEDTPILEGTE